MKHWMFVGSLIILGTVFVLRNKTQDRLNAPATHGVTVEQLKAATQRAQDQRERLATQPTSTTTRSIGVPADQIKGIRIAPATDPSVPPATKP